MAIIQLSHIREERRKQEDREEKERKKRRWRLIRTSKWSIAHHHYACDYCICPIFPGDQYVREMWANHWRFWIRRKHWPDCYAPTENEYREEIDRIEKRRESENHEERKSA